MARSFDFTIHRTSSRASFATFICFITLETSKLLCTIYLFFSFKILEWKFCVCALLRKSHIYSLQFSKEIFKPLANRHWLYKNRCKLWRQNILHALVNSKTRSLWNPGKVLNFSFPNSESSFIYTFCPFWLCWETFFMTVVLPDMRFFHGYLLLTNSCLLIDILAALMISDFLLFNIIFAFFHWNIATPVNKSFLFHHNLYISDGNSTDCLTTCQYYMVWTYGRHNNSCTILYTWIQFSI